jgi:hypothetical protein
MFSISLQHAEHVRRYSVFASQSSGWEVVLEQDRQVQQRDHYGDWHRVERALAMFKLEVSDLTARGWRIGEMSRWPA